MSGRERLGALSMQIAFLAVLFGVWYVVTEGSQITSLFLPRLPRVWSEMVGLAASGRLYAAALVTIPTIAKAFAIAAVLGIAVGFLVGRSERLVRLLEPMLSGMFAIPITLFFPLFILFFGIGPDSKVAYGAAYGFFPIALNTIAGFSSVDAHFLRAAKAMGASRYQLFRHVYLPAALPVVLTGLRIGFFISFAAVLGGETISSAAGVGRAIALSGELMETARMFAWIGFVVLATMILNIVVLAAESRTRRD